MLLNHTQHLQSNQKKIDQFVGTSYSLIEKIKMGGAGSEKMQIVSCSQTFKEVLNKHQEINYGSLEIRTKGIIVHFNNGQQYHVWCIPFYHLSIFKTDTLNIHGAGSMVKFYLKKKQNERFLNTLLEKHAAYQKRFELPQF